MFPLSWIKCKKFISDYFLESAFKKPWMHIWPAQRPKSQKNGNSFGNYREHLFPNLQVFFPQCCCRCLSISFHYILFWILQHTKLICMLQHWLKPEMCVCIWIPCKKWLSFMNRPILISPRTNWNLCCIVFVCCGQTAGIIACPKES